MVRVIFPTGVVVEYKSASYFIYRADIGAVHIIYGENTIAQVFDSTQCIIDYGVGEISQEPKLSKD